MATLTELCCDELYVHNQTMAVILLRCSILYFGGEARLVKTLYSKRATFGVVVTENIRRIAVWVVATAGT